MTQKRVKMRSYIEQRNRYQSKAIKLRMSGLSCGRISKIIPVSPETIRRWFSTFASKNNKKSVQMKAAKFQQETSPRDESKDTGGKEAV